MKKLSEKDDEFCKMIVWENFLRRRLMLSYGIPVMMRVQAWERAGR